METRAPPVLYKDPPSFDIELDEFETLSLCRLEAFQLLRKGRRTSDDSGGRLAQERREGDDRQQQ